MTDRGARWAQAWVLHRPSRPCARHLPALVAGGHFPFSTISEDSDAYPRPSHRRSAPGTFLPVVLGVRGPSTGHPVSPLSAEDTWALDLRTLGHGLPRRTESLEFPSPVCLRVSAQTWVRSQPFSTGKDESVRRLSHICCCLLNPDALGTEESVRHSDGDGLGRTVSPRPTPC